MGVQVKSLAWKLVLPVPLVLALSIAAAWTIIPDLIASNTRQAAVASAIETVDQFKALRGYYTKNVIAKVKANGSIKPAIDHAGVANRVPLPATLIHDLSQLLQQQNTSIRLYSAYPFPNRKMRQMDDFQTEAWAHLSANPDAVFARQTRVGENTVVRVAIADTMSAKGCVGCHNAHPDTPKNDWQLGDVRGVLEVDAVIDDQLAAGSALANKIVTATSLAALIVLAISLTLARHVIGPVARMSRVMNRLAEGEMEFDVADTKRSDELGAMARSVEVFRQSALEMEQLRAQQAEQERADAERQDAQRRQVAAEKTKSLHSLADNFDRSVNAAVDQVSSAAGQMQQSARQMTGTIDQSTAQSAAVAAAAEEASTNVQTVAAAAEELSGSINEVSRQVSKCASIAQRAAAEAGETETQITTLSDATNRIGDVVKLINDVASQTNLLALNATIEAARAGEAGKGFAVVAGEVKTLAGQTANATDEIGAQISGIQSAASDFVDAMRRVAGTIDTINEIATSIAAAVEQQNAATGEISRNVHEASAATRQVSENIASISDNAQDSSATAETVADAAKELVSQSESLHDAVAGFIKDIRAA